jgi:hypothetical protein
VDSAGHDTVDLDLFFEGAGSLGTVMGILRDIDDLYRTCLTLADPAADPDAPGNQPQVEIHTGSLLVQMAATVEPGVWGGTAVLIMKFMLTNGPELAKLPPKMLKNYRREMRLAEKYKPEAGKVGRHNPVVGEEARRRGKGGKKADKPAVKPPATPPGAPLRPLPGPSVPQGESGHGRLIGAITEAARFANDGGAQLVRFSQTAESWLAFLAESVAGSENELSAGAVAGFEAVRQNVGEAARILNAAEGRLQEYLAHLRRDS